MYLYKKGLSEVWYAHKTFWLLNTLTNLASLIWALAGNLQLQSYLTHIAKGAMIALNIALIYLMINTTPRSIEQPRSGTKINPEGIFLDNV